MSKYGYILVLCSILATLIIISAMKEECNVCKPMVEDVTIKGFTKVVEQ